MSRNSKRVTVFATACAVASILAVALVSLRPGPVEAQGVMSTPACQCSAVTELPAMSSRLVHCMCGAMACVLSRTDGPQGDSAMQCVK